MPRAPPARAVPRDLPILPPALPERGPTLSGKLARHQLALPGMARYTRLGASNRDRSAAEFSDADAVVMGRSTPREPLTWSANPISDPYFMGRPCGGSSAGAPRFT